MQRRHHVLTAVSAALPLLVVIACGSSPATIEPPGVDAGNPMDTGTGPTSCPVTKPLACGTTCVDPTGDPDNCGKCGTICSANTTCNHGQCCAAGLIVCPPSTACTNLQTDPQNCGSCDNACVQGQLCTNGQCACPAGSDLCNGACVSEQSDGMNCGACGTTCPTGFVCSNGMCSITCSMGEVQCSQSSCANTMTDPQNCGGCSMSCPQRPNSTAGCMGSNCEWVCLPMYVDLDGDLNAQPRTVMSDGCECHVTNTVDVPDLMFQDTNCDGIDGDINHAIFVSPRGDDSQPGTMARPLKTLHAAIAAAQTAGKDVYAALGTYSETVDLVSGVNLYGGYDDTVNPARWGRALGNTTTIQGSTVAVVGANLNQNVEVQLFTIRSSPSTGAGSSSYGVQLYGTAANTIVTLRGDTIVTSDATAGSAGTPGSGGVAGTNGSDGANGGAGGTSPCGGNGGSGGPVVCGENNGDPGGGGGGICGGQAGQGTTGHGSCGGSGGDSAPDDATAGCQGVDGQNATAPAAQGSFSSSGVYSPVLSSRGTNGTNGSGGGGGGSGSGDSDVCFFCCTTECGGGGGGGGAGGCAGVGGGGGTGGGASVAVVAINTSLVIDTTNMTAGHGGAGGGGGNGGLGGGAGNGGAAQPSQGGEAGNGAPGKAGARGGHAGSGAGAPGGPSSCIVYSSAFAPTLTNFNCSTSGGGAGGSGGSNTQLGQAPSGATGQTANTIPI